MNGGKFYKRTGIFRLSQSLGFVKFESRALELRQLKEQLLANNREPVKNTVLMTLNPCCETGSGSQSRMQHKAVRTVHSTCSRSAGEAPHEIHLSRLAIMFLTS